MILKQLVERFDFDIISFIFKQYKKLEISLEQATVLMHLFNLLQSRKIISISSISKGVSYSSLELGRILDSLIEQGFLVTNLETTKGGKQKEVYNLDPTYDKIETFLTKNQSTEQEDLTDISHTIQILEKNLNRILRSNEIEIVRSWYEQSLCTSEDIIKIITKSNQKVTIQMIDKSLHLQKNKPTLEKNPNVEKAIETLFKSR